MFKLPMSSMAMVIQTSYENLLLLYIVNRLLTLKHPNRHSIIVLKKHRDEQHIVICKYVF